MHHSKRQRKLSFLHRGAWGEPFSSEPLFFRHFVQVVSGIFFAFLPLLLLVFVFAFASAFPFAFAFAFCFCFCICIFASAFAFASASADYLLCIDTATKLDDKTFTLSFDTQLHQSKKRSSPAPSIFALRGRRCALPRTPSRSFF